MDLTDVIDEINSLKDVPIDKLLRNSKGDLRFDDLRSQFEIIQKCFNLIKKESISLLPDFKLNRFLSISEQILIKLKSIQILGKDPSIPDNSQKRGIMEFFDLPSNYKDLTKNQFNGNKAFFMFHIDEYWQLIIDSLTIRNLNIANVDFHLSKRREIESISQEAYKKFKEIENLASTAKEELGEGGVNKHMVLFSIQADLHADKSVFWRNWIIGLLVVTFFVIIGMFAIITLFFKNPVDKIEPGIFTALLISFLSYGIVLCAKNYFAEKHNEMINKHKANCLGSYNTFIESADPQMRQTILSYATQTIFSHQKSGFLAGESDNQNPNPVVEIIKNIPASNNG